jgi:hypothetical protein
MGNASSPAHVSTILERGEEHPTLDLLIRVAKGLRVELYELFTYDAKGDPDQLRRKLADVLADTPAHELRRVLRVLDALAH